MRSELILGVFARARGRAPPVPGHGSSEEQVLNVKAQIYVLDAATSNWAPASTTVIGVSLLYDPASNFTRAVGMENSQVRLRLWSPFRPRAAACRPTSR